MKSSIIAALLLIVVCVSCDQKAQNTDGKSSISGEFPEEVPLRDLKTTEFALTLENKLSDSLNSIYTPAFLFAWQEFKNYYKHSIEISASNSLDLKLIDQSNTFKNSLNKDEYQTEIDTLIGGVLISAYFKKALPFAVKFHPQSSSISFASSQIKSFGINYPDDSLKDYFDILYYLDDDHFAIKLFPADTSSEIILAKGIDLSGTFSDLLSNTNKWIKAGNTEKTTKAKAWKYTFEERDYLSIPVMKFNIGTNFDSLTRQKFTIDKRWSYIIARACQHTAFMLDEYGPPVESNAEVTVVAVDSIAHIEISTPKTMIFNKPFVIFIKKKNNSNPYFAMKVINAELMEKR